MQNAKNNKKIEGIFFWFFEKFSMQKNEKEKEK